MEVTVEAFEPARKTNVLQESHISTCLRELKLTLLRETDTRNPVVHAAPLTKVKEESEWGKETVARLRMEHKCG